jgi:tetratricopeptide (TPR) repeat protein
MTAEELIAQGQRHQENREFAAAAESYLRAFELAPTDGRLPWEAARLYLYFVSEAALAVRWFEAALPLLDDPFMARDTRYHLGLAHTFLADDERAAARFEEVLEDTPSHVLACIEQGKLLTRRGDHARAKDLLQQAVLHNNMRSTLPEMFPDGQKGSAHAAALAWMNLGRLALVAGDDEALGQTAVTHLLEDLDDHARVMTLAKEARAAGKPQSALLALGEVLARYENHEAAAELWFTIALDDLKQLDDVVEMAASITGGDPEWAARMVSEVLRRDPSHPAALAFRPAADPT